MIGGGFGREEAEHVWAGRSCRRDSGKVCTDPRRRDGWSPVPAYRMAGNVEEQDLAVKNSVVEGVGGRHRTHSDNFNRSDPVEREFCLEHCCIGVFLCTLVDDGREVVDACPTDHGERGRP